MSNLSSLPRRRFLAALGGSFAFFAAFTALLTTAFADGPQPKVGDMAPDFTLSALDGKKVKLSSLTKKGPVALIVLRGFPGYQCPICTMQVGELITNSDKFAAIKTPVLLVYPGPSADLQRRASEFAAGKNLPKNFTFVVDPDYKMVNQYGLRWNAANETAYPSTFVLDKDGKIVFAKISTSHGGRTKAAEILAAVPK